MPQAIRYIRFSSDQQRYGSSVARQQESIDKWLAKNPQYQLSNLSASDLGKSGYKGEHLADGAGLNSIIQAIHDRKINTGDVILVEALDRLGRLEPLKMISLISTILSSGVEIVTLEQGHVQRYSEESLTNNMGELYMLVGKVQMAHDYSRKLSERISAANREKIKKIAKGEHVKFYKTPWWLDNTGKLIPDRAELAIVIIEEFKKGNSIRGITALLHDQYSEKLSKTAVETVLTSRAVYGVYQNKDRTEMVLNAYESLISEEDYHSLQLLKSSRPKQSKPQTSSKTILSSFIRCGCGAGTHKVNKNGYDYLRCNRYGKVGNSCGEKQFPYHLGEWAFYRFSRKALQQWTRSVRVNEYEQEIHTIDVRLSELNEQADNLTDLFAVTGRSQLKEKIADIQEKINKLEGQRGLLSVSSAEQRATMTVKEEFLQSEGLLGFSSTETSKFLNILRLSGYSLTLIDAQIVSSAGQVLKILKHRRSLVAHQVEVLDEKNPPRSFLIRKDLHWKEGDDSTWLTPLDADWAVSNWSQVFKFLDELSEKKLFKTIEDIALREGFELSDLSPVQRAALLLENGTQDELKQLEEAIGLTLNFVGREGA
ncbi:hypothetical protein XMD579_002162 [Marinobacterium sp. xm-d-579]|nr:hypothetical protein [Marinobacterium sp. xm-d-579]